MSIVVYSQSASLKQHFKRLVTMQACFFETLELPLQFTEDSIYVIHINSYTDFQVFDFINNSLTIVSKIVIVDDVPSIKNMLHYAQQGVQAYCNSYMAGQHYQQLIDVVKNGQSWYPPQLLTKALKLAHKNTSADSNELQLKRLTPREKQIAMSIAEGKSNKLIAREHDISERTVKSHLTHIYEKLAVKDRVALAIYLQP